MNKDVTESPPIPPRIKGKFSRFVDGTKRAASVSSSIVKIGFNIILVLFILSFASSLAGGTSSRVGGSTEILFGEGPETIAVLDLTGTIVDVAEEGPFGAVAEPNIITPRSLLKQFETIKNDDAVKAVILRINSPGGSVTASEEIYQLINRFRTETAIPVIASQGEISASRAYYISLAADNIIAAPTTLTGSIGAIASTINVKELADRFGIKKIAVTSGENKNFFSPLQEVNPGQQEQLQQMVNEIQQQFIERVSNERNIDPALLATITDGRPVTGEQALQLGLVDQTGTFYDAVKYVRTMINAPDAAVAIYKQEGILQSLFQIIAAPLKQFNPVANLRLPTSHFFPGTPAYLYSP